MGTALPQFNINLVPPGMTLRDGLEFDGVIPVGALVFHWATALQIAPTSAIFTFRAINFPCPAMGKVNAAFYCAHFQKNLNSSNT